MKKTKKPKSTDSDINFSLVENGLDFVESSLRHIVKKSGDRNVKYAILHLCSGILLLLKERVRREHWALLFASQSQANKEKYLRGDFNSLNFDQLLDVIKNVCSVEVPSDAEKSLSNLRNIRNKAEHFGFHANSFALKATSAKALDFLIDFVHNELEPSSFSKKEQALFKKIEAKLPGFTKFVSARENRLKSQLTKFEGLILSCPNCDLRYVIRDQDGYFYKCLFCNQKTEDFEALGHSYIENNLGISSYITTKDGGEWPQYDCLECNQTCLIPKERSFESGYFCLNCDAVYGQDEVDKCTSCGTLIMAGDLNCSDCFAYATRD